MYRPSDLSSYLEALGASPRKSLSQNFLTDKNILLKIAKAAELAPSETVLEIGPGPGALTEQLLEKGCRVIAVEIDKAFARGLKRLEESSPLTVIQDDILKVDLEKLLSGRGPVKAVGNLPYRLTTPIITRFLPLKRLFSKLVFMVQEEVAARLTAKPKSREWGSLSLLIRYYSDPSYAFSVSRSCFYPQPKVDSAVVSLDLKTPPPLSDPERFFRTVRAGFGKKRKMLRSSLRDLYQPQAVEKALLQSGLNPLARPEELSLEEFILLFESLESDQQKRSSA